jgi:hypothetical protein
MRCKRSQIGYTTTESGNSMTAKAKGMPNRQIRGVGYNYLPPKGAKRVNKKSLHLKLALSRRIYCLNCYKNYSNLNSPI